MHCKQLYLQPEIQADPSVMQTLNGILNLFENEMQKWVDEGLTYHWLLVLAGLANEVASTS